MSDTNKKVTSPDTVDYKMALNSRTGKKMFFKSELGETRMKITKAEDVPQEIRNNLRDGIVAHVSDMTKMPDTRSYIDQIKKEALESLEDDPTVRPSVPDVEDDLDGVADDETVVTKLPDGLEEDEDFARQAKQRREQIAQKAKEESDRTPIREQVCLFTGKPATRQRRVNRQTVFLSEEMYQTKTTGEIAEKLNSLKAG